MQWGVLPLAITLSACSLAPTYQRPEAPIPARFDGSNESATAGNAGNESAIPLSESERLFLAGFSPDHDLGPLVERALAHNRDFRIATLQVEQARALNRIDRSQQLPAVDASAQRNRQQFSNPDLNAGYGQNLSTAAIGIADFDLDFFGRIRSLSEASSHRYLASVNGQRAFRATLVAEILRAYVIERAAAAAAKELQAIDSDMQAMLRLAERQQQVGTISQDDVSLQRSDAEHARTNLQQAEVEATRARNALQLIVGHAIIAPAGTVEQLASPDESLDWLASLPSEVLLQRPDIMQAEEQLRASNADIGAARAAFFPSIRLSTSLGTASDSLGGLFEAGTRFWTFIPQITLPIFNHGRNSANLDLAHLRNQAAVADYEKTVQSAFREVSDALVARVALADRLRSERRLTTTETDRVRLVNARFEAGWEDRPRLLAARMRLTQVRINGIHAQRDLALNRISLYHAFYGVQTNESSAMGKKT